MFGYSRGSNKKDHSILKASLLVGASVLAMSPITAAMAQSQDGGTIAEIVILGEKRETTLQESQLSITAVQEDLLKTANITDASGLNGYVPGLLITKSGGSERMVSIRGVGQGTPQNFFTQPGVSFHIDGAYIPNSIALNMGFFDVERVEVLRGPQGTVFGQSSTGGTINVITKKPNFDGFNGEISGTLGNHNYFQTSGALNIPIADTLAIRGSFQKHGHDGYSRATSVPGIANYELDDADNRHFRLAALWEPTPDLSFLLSGTSYDDNHNGAALKNLNDPISDPRVVTQDHPATFSLSSDFLLFTAEYSLPFATLKSVTSYQDLEHDQSFDTDRLDIPTFGGYDHVATWATGAETWMQEVTVSSADNSWVEWIGGFFFTSSKSDQYVIEYRELGVTSVGPIPVLPRSTTPAGIPSNLAYENESFVKRTSWAPFFQAKVNITDRLSATVGVRYNSDKYSGFGSDYYGPRNPRAFDSTTWTGKAALSYDILDDSMVYASFSRGYKPGGINTGASSALVVEEGFKPEIVESVEVGTKNLFFDKRLMLNASAYYTFYDDTHYIQEDPIPFSGGIGNVPKSEIYGVELEGLLLLFNEQLELSGNLSILDGEIKSDYLALDRRLADAAGDAAVATGTIFPWTFPWFQARGAAATQVLGNEPANLSNTFRVSATWHQPIKDFGELSARAEYISTGNYQARIFNTAGADETPGYEQVNLNVQLVPDDAIWSLSASAINVTDEDGVSGRFVDPYSSGQVSNEYIPPRQFLVTLGLEF